MAKPMKTWRFKGTVVCDGRTSEYNWEGETSAPTVKKAISNLVYRYKKDHNIPKPVKVELYGPVEEVTR